MHLKLVRKNEATGMPKTLPHMDGDSFRRRNRFGWYERSDGIVEIYLNAQTPVEFPSKEAALDAGYNLGD